MLFFTPLQTTTTEFRFNKPIDEEVTKALFESLAKKGERVH